MLHVAHHPCSPHCIWEAQHACPSKDYNGYLVFPACPQDSVTSVVVHGCEIIASSVDGTIRRFDVRMGRMYVDELHHAITSVSVSHDGLCVLGACLDSTLRLLDKASGQLLASYTGHVHQSVRMDCCLTPDDAYVVGCSETGACVPKAVLQCGPLGFMMSVVYRGCVCVCVCVCVFVGTCCTDVRLCRMFVSGMQARSCSGSWWTLRSCKQWRRTRAWCAPWPCTLRDDRCSLAPLMAWLKCGPATTDTK